MESLIQDLIAGKRRALARLLTLIENERPEAQSILAQIYPHTGKAWVIGVTGAPGTGKSSLVNALAKVYRQNGKTVAILAVDPTSPFSGGAILGDRIRMNDLSGDKGVFIRSMATRGSLGGLARTSRDMLRVMDAGGFDIILVETVGAGQSEVDIVRTANTTLVIEAPGLGDDVQAIKAGILEIADILVVNKSDRTGADQTMRSLRAMLELGHPAAREHFVSHHGRLIRAENAPSAPIESSFWLTPVMKTSTSHKEGIVELVEKIAAHRDYIQQSQTGKVLEARYLEIEIYERLQDALIQRLTTRLDSTLIKQVIEKIQVRQLDPQTAVAQLLDELDARSKEV